MTTKQQILEVIERMPDEISISEAIEKLHLLERIRVGLAQADAGELVSHEEVKRRFLSTRAANDTH